MTLVHPLFLGGLLAIAVPVFVHMMRRETAERVLFPAAMLLVGSAEVVRRRRTFTEKLLLALRVSLLASVVLAFARPRLFLAAPGGGRFLGSVAIVVDDTPSMGAALVTGSPNARMREARGAVLEVLARLEAGSRVRLDAASGPLLEGSLDLEECRRVARSLAPKDAAPTLARALADSLSWLRSEPPPRELVVISDFQASSWRELDRTRPDAGTPVHAVNLGAPLDDCAVLDLWVADERAYAGAPFELRARVRSSRGGSRDAELVVPGRPVRRRTLHLIPGAIEEFGFDLVETAVGPLVGELRLAGADDWSANDWRAFAVDVCAPPRVLCVGSPAGEGELASELIARALEPFAGGEHALARVERTTPPLGGARSLARFDCIFLASPSALSGEDWRALAQFVEEGGALAAFADAGMADEDFWARARGTLPAGGAELRSPEGPARLVGCDWSHPVLRSFAGGANGGLETVAFRRFLALRRASGSCLARFSHEGASSAIVASSRGRGRVLFVASSPAPGWSTLFRESSFVPFVHEVAAHLARAERQPPVLAGERASIALHPAERGCEFTLAEAQVSRRPGPKDPEERSPSPPVARSLAADMETLTLRLGRLERRGVVRITSRRLSEAVEAGPRAGTAFGFERERALAVELDPRESDPARVDPVSVLGMGTRVSRSAEELARSLDALRGGTELSPALAWAALGLLVAEMLLSWRLTRARSRIVGLGPNLRGTI